MQKSQQSPSEKDYVIYAAYGILDNNKRRENKKGENKRFTDDGNLFIDENRTLSTTVFKTNENGDIDTIPYVGNPGKEEYPCILYEIDEDNISILGYTNGDSNTAFNKSNFIDFSRISATELRDLEGNTLELHFDGENGKNIDEKIQEQMKDKNYKDRDEMEKDKQNLLIAERKKQYNEFIAKRKGFIVNRYIYEPKGEYTGNIANNLTNEEIINFYKKDNNAFREKVQQILQFGIQNIFTQEYKCEKQLYLNNGCVIKKINDNEYKIDSSKYGDKHTVYVGYVGKNIDFIHCFYNEFVLEPKRQDRIVRSKGITLCFFHNEKQQKQEWEQQYKIDEYYAQCNNGSLDKNKYRIDDDGYQRFTTREICDTIEKNLDKIKKFQTAKGLDTINIIEEDGDKHQIKLSDIEQYIQNKKNGISCDNLWMIKNDNIAKKNIVQNTENNKIRSNNKSGIIIKKNIDYQDNDLEVEDVLNRIVEKQKTRLQRQKDKKTKNIFIKNKLKNVNNNVSPEELQNTGNKQNNIFDRSGILNNANNNDNVSQTEDLPWWKKIIVNFLSCKNSCKTCLEQERNSNEVHFN